MTLTEFEELEKTTVECGQADASFSYENRAGEIIYLKEPECFPENMANY